MNHLFWIERYVQGLIRHFFTIQSIRFMEIGNCPYLPIYLPNLPRPYLPFTIYLFSSYFFCCTFQQKRQ